MNKVKEVAKLYVPADRCARAEEGRKYPGKDAGAETDPTDDSAMLPLEHCVGFPQRGDDDAAK